jgi:hypothetical protein
MKILHPYPYDEARITTAFGWDEGPSEKERKGWTAEQQAKAAETWPRNHQGEDLSLLLSTILGKGFRWADYPIVCPIDGGYVEFIARDRQACSVLRIIGPWWEVRIKHVIYAELSRELIEMVARHDPIPAGTVLGPPGNVGLSFGAGPGQGRHLHISFLGWGRLAEGFFRARLGPAWSENKIPEYVKTYGKAYAEDVQGRGIQWINDAVLRKYGDPHLHFACYEAAISRLIG